jgi:Rad9
MDCVVNDVASVRTLARLVQCAARIGDEVTFTASRDSLRVRTLNASHSACAEFVLLRPFFAAFSSSSGAAAAAWGCGGAIPQGADAPAAAAGGIPAAEPAQQPSARVPARALLPIFRAPAAIERVRIALRSNGGAQGGGAARGKDARPGDGHKQHSSTGGGGGGGGDALVITVRARSAVRKAFRVPVLAGYAPHAVYARDRDAGCLYVRPRFFIDVLANFHARLDEITFSPTPAALRIASFVDDAANPQSSILRTEMSVDHREFDLFRVPEHRPDVSLTFYFKPFRAVLDFCEHFDAPLSMYFHDSGQPILFSIELAAPGAAKHFEATFIFATRIVQDADTQTPNTPSTSDATTGGPQASLPISAPRVESQGSRRPRPSLTPSQRHRRPPLPTSNVAAAPATAAVSRAIPIPLMPSSSSSPAQSQIHQQPMLMQQLRPRTEGSENGASEFAKIPGPCPSDLGRSNPGHAAEGRPISVSGYDDEYVEGTPPPSP